jgi:hypothetical protein
MRIGSSRSLLLYRTDDSDLFASLLGRRIQMEEDTVENQPAETMDLSDGMRIFG